MKLEEVLIETWLISEISNQPEYLGRYVKKTNYLFELAL